MLCLRTPMRVRPVYAGRREAASYLRLNMPHTPKFPTSRCNPESSHQGPPGDARQSCSAPRTARRAGFLCPALSVALLFATQPVFAVAPPTYRDPALSPAARVADLLPRLSLEEKIGQMAQFVGPEQLRRVARAKDPQATDDTRAFYPTLSTGDLLRLVREGRAGSFINIMTVEEANTLQRLAAESRLGIPLLLCIDAIHGNTEISGATVYPTMISLAATFDDPLVEEMGRQVALEVRALGTQWNLSPMMNVSRDPRWGRIGENFGEDPFLTGRIASALIQGYQHRGAFGPDSVLACAKGYLADSATIAGLNFAPAEISERALRSLHLPPFLAAVKAGVGSVMLAHAAVDGVPSHVNSWLMEDVLRGEAGFDGFFVSDWTDVERVATLHRVATDRDDAVYQSVSAGLDLNMQGPGFPESLLKLVRAGRISEARIDQSVARILKTKFQLGLFEQALVDPARKDTVLFQPAHQRTALEAARKSLVLMRNEGALLPLDGKRHRRVLVTGPLADSTALLGDWTHAQPAANTTTPLAGLRAIAPAGVEIVFADVGRTVRHTDAAAIAAAATQAKAADIAVVFVGENPLRYEDSDRTIGENRDRSDIDLPGQQLELVQALAATGKPVVVVVISGRPNNLEWIAGHVPAIVYAWEPGSKGGQAIAEALFGVINPGGRLPMSFPRHAGHIPVAYNLKPPLYYRKYVLGPTGPLFSFGHGLSYTSFRYSNLRVTAHLAPGADINLSVDVTNTGTREGDEVVLAYVNDVVASVTMPVRELQAYQRLTLAPGETRTVALVIPPDQLALYNRQMRRVVEPGDFDLFVGPLTARFTVLP